MNDDEAMADSTVELLSVWGHEVFFSSSGMDAIGLSMLSQFDAVITDILMPDMDGLEVVRSLRALHPDLTIVPMSGARQGARSLYLSAAKKFGVDAIIEKPFDVGDLLEFLDRL